MSSNLTGLPPSAIARLNAVANMQAVAVKLVSLPSGLQNNISPVKIEGTVAGQNPDGSMQIETERGIVNILLKDRSPLLKGMKLELEIPAGRHPQQASIRPAADPAPTTASAQPTLAQTLAQQSPIASSTAASQLKLDRAASLKATEIADALRAASPQLADMVAALKVPPAPLLPGQNIRLIPLPPGQAQIGPLPQDALIAALASLIENLPSDQQTLKTHLTTLLGRMNLSSVEVPSADGKAPPSLPPNIKTLLQMPADTIKTAPSAIPAPLRYDPALPFSFSKPVDVQVAAFMTAALKSSASPLMPSTPGQIQIAPSILSNQRAPSASASMPAQILPGQVSAFTRDNLPVLTFPNPGGGAPVSFIAQFPAGNLQIGSPLLVSVLPSLAAGQPTLMPLSSWMQPGLWDSLTDLIQSVHQINPGMAHSLTQILPQPAQPQNMGGLVLLFLSVLRSGDVESWMSPQIANLLRLGGKTDTLRALTTDIALSGRADAASLPQDWRAAMFPIYHDQQAHKIPFYYKHQEEEDSDDRKERRTKMMRFLFDLKLARMGNVQIDGFMQKERLDMIMRTKSPLSVPMQRTMQGLYAKAMNKSDLSGELTFQFKPEHWVTMDDQMIGLSDDHKTPDHLII